MFDVTIFSTEGKEHHTEVERISIPTTNGTRTILKNHVELFANLEIGKVMLKFNNQERKNVAISEGIFHFKDNQARLIVRTFELASEIDIERAEAARDRAKASLEEQSHDRAEMIELELALKRALVRLSATK